MKKHILLSVLLLVLAAKIPAQVALKGQITGLPAANARAVVFEYWLEDQWLRLDTANLDAAGFFQKTVTGSPGQCRIRVWSQARAWRDFLLPQDQANDALLDFGTIKFEDMAGGPALVTGNENETNTFLQGYLQRFLTKRDSISKAVRELKSEDPDARANKGGLYKSLDNATEDANYAFKIIGAKNKGTFAGDIVARLLYMPTLSDLPPDTTSQLVRMDVFQREHMLDRIPFNDARVLRHSGFIIALNNYREKCFADDGYGRREYIDHIMLRRGANESVNAWLFKFLLDKFMDMRDESSVTHLVKNYAPDCSTEDGHLPGATRNLVLALQNCVVGQPAKDVALPDLAGKMTSLASIATKNKVTLLFIWRSGCSHCREFEPVLASIYQKYHPRGVEVVGISIDKNEQDWRAFVSMHPFPWPTLWVSEAVREEFYRSYPVSGTPTMISVDAHMTVLDRMFNRNSLEQYLDEELSKR